MSDVKPMDIFLGKLKEQGIEIAEETAKAVVEALFDSAPDLVLATKNKYDDLLIPLLAGAKPQVMKLLENINKADNE